MLDLAPIRHRPETKREQDLRLELMAREHRAHIFCAEARRLVNSIAATVAHTDPHALQQTVGLRRLVSAYEEQWS